jgi:PST family polysaccharide transporter
LLAPINRALFPGYAKMSHDLPLLRRGVLNVLGAIYSLAIPAGIGIALVAEYLVPSLLGDGWAEAIPLLEVLAISGSLVAARANFATSLIAIGRPKVTTAVSAVHTILLVPTLIFAVNQFGLVGAAFAYLVIEALLLAVRYVVMMRILQITPAGLISRIWRPVASSLAMAGAISLGVKPFLAGTTLPTLLMLLICALSGALIYAISSLFLWLLAGRPGGPETFVLRKVRLGKVANDSLIVD